MKCESCIYEQKCVHASFKKHTEDSILCNDMMDALKLVCTKYKYRRSNTLGYGQKVTIKTREELVEEGYSVTDNGVFKDGKMYLNKSDLEYLGWNMQVEFKDSEYYGNRKLKGYSLIVAGFGFFELDMCNVEPCMFKAVKE